MQLPSLPVFYFHNNDILSGYQAVFVKQPIPRGSKTATAIVNDGILLRLAKINEILKTRSTPELGSSLYVSPGYKYSLNDIRNNYKLKRGVDTADYNVFSSIDYSTRKPDTKVVVCIIVPAKKLIIVNNDFSTTYFSSELLNKFNITDDYYLSFTSHGFYWIDLPQSYISLLNGELQKPCISDVDLHLYRNNQLTVDTLELVYRTGIQKDSEDSIRNYIIQLAAMNVKNWREYPGTIQILFYQLLYYRFGAAANAVCNNQKDYEKFVQELLENRHAGFISEEDYALCKSLIIRLLGPKLKEIDDWSSLKRTVSSIGLNKETFFELFDIKINVVENVETDNNTILEC